MSSVVHRDGRLPTPTGRRVLLVEDDPRLQAVLAEYLVLEGYEAMLAYNGDDGLRLARQHRPDVVILDLVLPRRSGTDVLRMLKAGVDTRDIPVLVMSGSGTVLLPHERRWTVAVLPKPLNLDELGQCLAHALQESGAPGHPSGAKRVA